ncbi:MAG TPA: hypothetical protein VMB50_11250, partial [Myxococcales bacterium]|nr:hypothetical protein [Myxococcales bacterium]
TTISTAALAAPRRIAVLDVRPLVGVSDKLGQAVTDVVVLEVRRQASGNTVIGADEVRAMVGLEREKAILGCQQTSCLAEIGGALGAERIVIGSLSKFGASTYLLDLKLLDARTARVVAEGSARFEKEDALPDAVAKAVALLLPGEAPAAAVSEAPAHHRPTAAAWSLGIAGVVVGAAGGVLWGLAAADRAVPAGLRYATYSGLQQANTFALVGDILVPVGAVALALGCGLGLFGGN